MDAYKCDKCGHPISFTSYVLKLPKTDALGPDMFDCECSIYCDKCGTNNKRIAQFGKKQPKG